MNDMKPVRLAVIGAGVMGRKPTELIARHDTCSLIGICDVNCDRRSLAQEFNAPFYEELEELIQQERPEGVVISTPNGHHATVVEACASQSVHVLIEKPIADTLSSAHRIIELAETTGIHVLVGHHRRHNPLIQEARSVVKSGSLDKLVGVSVLWGLLKPAKYYEVDWRCRLPGGGPTFINLIQDLDSLVSYVARFNRFMHNRVLRHETLTSRIH
jgi:predicted dehydrogenase